jgi:1-acyl-sn-glycerol-3-phosphate acyltransferase
VDPFYAVVRVIARFWIWFFFERVEVRHPERVPRMGPVLLCINHPNNLIDSLLVGSVLPRKVRYLATAALFRNPLIARLVAIYPEGATRAAAHVQRIKTGAARIALGYEAHAPRRLTVVPVGLCFDARTRFRGRVLVSFGEPVAVSSYLAVYREEPAKALHSLTTAIQGAMEREVVHVARIGRSRTRSSTSATRTPTSSSGSGNGFSGTTPDLPPTGLVTRRCGLASSGRRTASGSHGHGRPS